jgi:magnesium-transporting ATPase (P-type)
VTEIVERDNNVERHFNDNDLLWDKKYFSVIKISYLVFIIICLINEYIYYKNFHNNGELLLILFPFCYFLTFGIPCMLKEIINNSHGDREYLLTYYPKVYKKMFFRSMLSGEYTTRLTRSNGFVFISFLIGSYIEYGDDKIIDDIRDRLCIHYKILFGAMFICIIFIIITIIIMGLKYGSD